MKHLPRHATAFAGFLLGAALCTLPGYARTAARQDPHQDQHPGIKQDMKNTGHSTADAGRTVGHDTAHGTKKVYRKTSNGTKKVYHKTAHGTSVGAHDTGHGAKVLGHDTAQGTRNVGDAIAGKPTKPLEKP